MTLSEPGNFRKVEGYIKLVQQMKEPIEKLFSK